jgi:hypothetical protein
MLELINTWGFLSFELLNALPNLRELGFKICHVWKKKNCAPCSKVIHYEIRAWTIYTASKFSSKRRGKEFMTTWATLTLNALWPTNYIVFNCNTFNTSSEDPSFSIAPFIACSCTHRVVITDHTKILWVQILSHKIHTLFDEYRSLKKTSERGRDTNTHTTRNLIHWGWGI